MNDEVKPRIWVGNVTEFIDVWSAQYCDGRFEWDFEEDERLHPGDIFVPGCEHKPTIDPSKMKTLETCDEVDW